MHHGLAAHEVVLLLETDQHEGLSAEEAAARLDRYGRNVLPPADTSGPLVRGLRQFNHPLIYVLLGAGTVTLVLGQLVDTCVIFGVVVVNAAVGFVQESRAQAALDVLRGMVHTQARVVRDGRVRSVSSEQVVPGDLVQVEAGDKVPADLRLIRVAQLALDESALTGESQPVAKDEVVLPQGTPVADRRNMLYAGTLVTHGSGEGVVVATGVGTELGEIHRLVGAAAVLATPLTRKLGRFSAVLTGAILGLAAFTFAAGIARGEPAAEMFTAAVALAVGAVPEGLPAAVTITLAIGVARLVRRGTVVRRLPAVETLGSTTVICADKTGTLTQNEMTVTALWTPSEKVEVTGLGYSPDGAVLDSTGAEVDLERNAALRWCLVAGVGCNDAVLVEHEGRWSVVGDPTEGAMLVVAAKAGVAVDAVAAQTPRVAVLPFSPERQFMATLHASSVGTDRVVLAKGSVERVLDLCAAQLSADGGLLPLDRAAATAAAEELAGRGLRVLATAVSWPGDGQEDLESGQLTGSLVLTGLQAMQDPPRASAAAAVRVCHTAGIAVKMITGDHAVTAVAVARQVGILDADGPQEVLTGAELEGLQGSRLAAAVDRVAVFARVSPEQKLRLVEGLQQAGHVVAMTGDGVNDAPSLRQADIGVAMGRSGTEVAKEASDMVLTDDDFATIEAAVEEGRAVFDNITKFIVWTLPTNMGEGLVILLAVILGADLPVLPAQILWINMTTALALGLMLAFEPKEEGIMERPPRDPGRPLLTGALVSRVVLVAGLLVGGSWWLFEWERGNGASLAEARCAAVNLIVAVEATYLFACRSLTRSVFRIGLTSNRWVLGGIGLQLAGQLALTYLPFMHTLFDTASIDPGAWLRILLLSAVAGLVVAVDKRWGRSGM